MPLLVSKQAAPACAGEIQKGATKMKQPSIIPQAVAAIIPQRQLQAIKRNINAYIGVIEHFEAQLKKCPSLIERSTKPKEHPVILHYFTNDTDIYIGEYDGHNFMYGYAIFDKNITDAQFDYFSRTDIIAIPGIILNCDKEEQTIEAALHKRYPNHFRDPQSPA
jgi:hypothetical protein